MKTTTPSSDLSTLNALLATRAFYCCDLFQFSLIDGTVLNYAGGDQDIIANGITWPCGATTNGPFMQRQQSGSGSNMTATGTGNRGLISQKIGTQVDTLSFDCLPGSATVEGFPFIQAVKLGIFDGAECIMYRAYMPTYGNTSAGIVNMFTGRVVEIDCGRSLVTFNINSHLELLSQQFPRNLYQPGCLNNFCDSACTLVLSDFTATGTISSGTTTNTINCGSTQATGYYNFGTITFTSGQNEGFKRNIKNYTLGTPSTVSLLTPLAFTPSSGDTFTIAPGCAKNTSICQGQYNNLANFRGFPAIPMPETSV